MEDIALPAECIAKLEACTSLPSPPKVALQIIQMVKDPDIEIDNVVHVLALDPALSVKILRMANSPLYGQGKKVANLQKAIMVIGLNGILSLALSFSLVKSLRHEQKGGLDHLIFWRRALISGSAGLALAQMCGRHDQEELFMASFIQDLGMLVLDQIDPSLYAQPNVEQLSHQEVTMHEREHFGADHAMVGSWLLHKWNFPEDLLRGIRYSDNLEQAPPETKDRQFLQCVAFSGTFADLSISQVDDDTLFEISENIEQTLQLPSLAFVEVFKKIKQLVQESAPLFEINCQDGFDPDATLERAKELMTLRQIGLEQKLNTLTAQV
ncbi:MAG: HDOD domain-containing protein [Nitrospirae bacterium]|nr:HDOD domain-containing protein [Nitrospirota bacterium]MDA1305601.1 HDOD domain-containing protein [Nitrospirota bacterium]